MQPGETPNSFEKRLREDAMSWLAVRTNDGSDYLSREDILDYSIDGERFRLQPTQNGIHKPKRFDAALSIQTVYRPPGQERPYADEIGSDNVLRYKWQGKDYESWDNRSLRTAMERQLPLVWFVGVGMGPAVFQAIFPVYVLWEEATQHQFAIAVGAERAVVNEVSVAEESIKRYVRSLTNRRLHQPVFRSTVLRAYENRCSICNLGHSVLLDAAHIVPDSNELGIASVVNGLALCKIHHAAFDTKILGIRPDHVVQIRADLLEEIDGPMLRYGLQERHNQKLMALPKSRNQQPRQDLLEYAYEQFVHAG